MFFEMVCVRSTNKIFLYNFFKARNYLKYLKKIFFINLAVICNLIVFIETSFLIVTIKSMRIVLYYAKSMNTLFTLEQILKCLLYLEIAGNIFRYFRIKKN